MISLSLPRQVSRAAHIERGALADVFLDTHPQQAGSTGTDMLWAGVPIVSFRGSSMASRTGVSMLVAAGAPELAVDSWEEYEELAVSLGTNAARLAALHSRLSAGRASSPLFDTRRWVRDWERLARTILEEPFSPPRLDSVTEGRPGFIEYSAEHSTEHGVERSAEHSAAPRHNATRLAEKADAAQGAAASARRKRRHSRGQ